jgi:pimeloyl-ACP methyl ester carboxylesterase
MINFKKLIKAGVLSLAFLYCAVLAVLYFAQDSLVFPAPSAVVETLPDYADYAEMQTADGITLKHVRLRGDEGAPKIMFFHGNGALAAYEIERGRILQENGFDVLLVEYRGYGGSGGEPSAEALLKDSLEVYDWYKEDPSDWVFLYAHSLGTGVASYVASQRPVRSMALEAPYAVFSDVAASKHPIFPVRALFKHEINSAEYLKDNDTPVLITHGKRDQVIPLEFGKALYDSLDAENARMEVIENAGHNDLTRHGSIDLALGHFSKSF